MGTFWPPIFAAEYRILRASDVSLANPYEWKKAFSRGNTPEILPIALLATKSRSANVCQTSVSTSPHRVCGLLVAHHVANGRFSALVCKQQEARESLSHPPCSISGEVRGRALWIQRDKSFKLRKEQKFNFFLRTFELKQVQGSPEECLVFEHPKIRINWDVAP